MEGSGRKVIAAIKLRSMLPSPFLNLFNSLFSIFCDPHQPITSAVSTAEPRLTFQLRHLHAVSEHGHVLFSDVDHALRAGNLTAYASEEYTVDTRLLSSYRPPSFDAVRNARHRSMKYGQSTLLDWDEEEIVGPDVESRQALLTLAKMTSNAYLQPDDKEWYPLGKNWSTVRPQSFARSLKNSFVPTYRAMTSVGNPMRMDSVDTSSPLRTIQPSFCPSRAHRRDILAAEGQQRRKIN